MYKRKFLFFVAIAALAAIGFNISRFQSIGTISASINDNTNLESATGRYKIKLDLQNDGSVLIGGKKISEGVKALNDFDELRYIILNQPAETFSSAEIDLNLPKTITKLPVDPQIIAVHGAEASGVTNSGKQIIYRARNISQSSTITIVADFPKGYLTLPASKIISGKINSIPGMIWLIGGIALPTIAAAILIYMFLKSGYKGKKRVKEILETPPQKLSPAISGLIVNGKIGEREIMAVLIDLANRGFITLYNRESDLSIYRKSSSPIQIKHLRPYEIILLSRIFPPKIRRATGADVEDRLAENIFSREVAMIYLGAYSEAQSLGYFNEPPARVHLKFRLIGIASFFLGLLGYLFFAFYAPDPKFVLFFWLSLILFGFLIINLAPLMTLFTKKGISVRKQWLSFKNFLCEKTPLRGQDELFERYLPYAISLDSEAAWAGRFANANFVKPDWYDLPTGVNGIENFAESLLPAINYIAKVLSTSGETLVK